MTKTGALNVLVMVVGIVGCTTVFAEIPPMSDEQLADRAALIVTGYVTTISEQDETRHLSWKPWDKVVTANYTVTIEIEKVEKGSLAPGSHTLQFRGYEIIRRPLGLLGGSNTLRVHLKAGDDLKVYLERDGNHWELFHHSGLWMRR